MANKNNATKITQETIFIHILYRSYTSCWCLSKRRLFGNANMFRNCISQAHTFVCNKQAYNLKIQIPYKIHYAHRRLCSTYDFNSTFSTLTQHNICIWITKRGNGRENGQNQIKLFAFLITDRVHVKSTMLYHVAWLTSWLLCSFVCDCDSQCYSHSDWNCFSALRNRIVRKNQTNAQNPF